MFGIDKIMSTQFMVSWIDFYEPLLSDWEMGNSSELANSHTVSVAVLISA